VHDAGHDWEGQGSGELERPGEFEADEVAAAVGGAVEWRVILPDAGECQLIAPCLADAEVGIDDVEGSEDIRERFVEVGGAEVDREAADGACPADAEVEFITEVELSITAAVVAVESRRSPERDVGTPA
jgi:hypothetical protein